MEAYDLLDRALYFWNWAAPETPRHDLFLAVPVR